MRLFDVGARAGPERVSDRVLTLPNLISLLRVAALPVIYIDLVSGRHARGFVLLVLFAASDWLDGYVARRFDQVTRLGKLMDPISDRLLFVVVGIAMVVGGLLPLWALLLLVVRDVLVVAAGLALLARGKSPPTVTRVGKAATFGLMWALPAFILAGLLGDGADAPQPVVQALAWFAFAVNTALYYVAAGQYARQVAARA